MDLKTIIQTFEKSTVLFNSIAACFFLYSMDSIFYVLFVFIIDFQKVLAGALQTSMIQGFSKIVSVNYCSKPLHLI